MGSSGKATLYLPLLVPLLQSVILKNLNDECIKIARFKCISASGQIQSFQNYVEPNSDKRSCLQSKVQCIISRSSVAFPQSSIIVISKT